MATNSTFILKDKPHYPLLDGLRGVAALMVVWYHIFEGFAFAGAVNGVGDGSITTFNHGYLAVDFFFMLSGYVISYAYDDRWKSMSVWQFFKRRLVRLHPMVAMGAIIGTAAFCIGGGINWNGEKASATNIILALVLGMLLIPAYPGARYDVRGNGEMFPLNGPSWSLFFEYLGNILYALFIRRFSTKLLKILVFVLGALFAIFAVSNASGYGSIGVGWTLDKVNFFGGTLRMLFPFTVGMLLQRTLFAGSSKMESIFRKFHSAGTTFIICSIALFGLFSVPFLGASESFCRNGIYEFLCIAIAFPLIVIAGAAATLPENIRTCRSKNHTGQSADSVSQRVAGFLGELSYPLYIVHYPVMYLFYSWLIKEGKYTLGQTWYAVIAVFAVSLTLAYIALKFYDLPIRKRLQAKAPLKDNS